MGERAEVRLIGLTGLPRSGKDTFAAHLVENHHYVRRAFATPLKAAAAILLGREMWEMEGQHGFDRNAILPEWGFSTREFLQKFGTECLRNQIRQDFWIEHMRHELDMAYRGEYPVVITDVRFDNEAALVRALGGNIIEIRRAGLVGSNHASDKGVCPDAVVNNNGTMMELWEYADRYA